MPFRLQLPHEIHDAMIAQARAELPNECCGLLAGPAPRDGVALVTQHYPLVNELASPVEYLSEPRGMFAAMKDMRRLGWDVLAVYHSHPTTEPVPSKTDLARSYSQDVMCLIISLQDGDARMRGWWLTASGYHEAEWEVVNPAIVNPPAASP